MGAQRRRLRIGWREFLAHQPVPEQPPGPQLGHLHEEVHADGPEEGKPWGKGIDVHAGGNAPAGILNPVGKRVGKLQVSRRAGFLHVIAGDGDGIELRHLPRCVGEDIGDDPHRRRGRVDVGIADHELLQNIVLNGSGQLVRRNTLFFRRDDVEGHDGQDGAVHRHGDGHGIERNAIEKLPHVQNAIDGNARHADIAGDARMIAVIAPVGGEVEGDG